MARRKSGNPVHGWVIIDKPQGIGSTNIVGKVRWAYEAQKAGHAGTLDPLASGILPIALGEATKTVPYLMAALKTYQFTVAWGARTETDDLEGAVVAESDVRPNINAINQALPAFIGEIEQIPPVYSAIKVDGERAYTKARRGDDVVLTPRKVVVKSFELRSSALPECATLEVICGKGTYIRALARDLAQALGTEGHVTMLRRTAVGPFNLERAISLEKLDDLRHSAADFRPLLPVMTALDDIPALAISAEEAARLRRGQEISMLGKDGAGPGGPLLPSLLAMDPVVAVLEQSTTSTPVAIGVCREGQFRPSRVFNL